MSDDLNFSLFHKIKFVLVAGVVAVAVAGCNGNDVNPIQKVTFKASDNLEAVRVALQFKPRVQTDLTAGFQIKNYGYLFLTPSSATQPFEVGFDLNTSLVNDQDYIKLTPTSNLPNGIALGLPYPLVEIHGSKPISSNVDVFGYADVVHREWLGTAAIFSFLNDKNFPEGLAINQVFLRDSNGKAGVMASVFGPTTQDGHLARAGGVALFANVKQLLHHMEINNNREFSLKPERKATLHGPKAALYQQHPNELRRLEKNFVNGLNGIQ